MQKSKGFSLIELITVLAVIGIVSAFIIAIMPGGDIQLRGEANKLMSVIRYTQQLSMSNSAATQTNPNAGRYRLFFSSNYYEIFDSLGNNVADSLAVCLNAGQTGNAKYYCNVSSKHYLIWPGKPNAYYLVFDSNGTPYSSAYASEQKPTDDAKLLDTNENPINNTVQLTNGRSTITITIDPYTGYLSSN
jgi:prepilin-type N-terminal cleavage/methylation domain-containing protein